MNRERWLKLRMSMIGGSEASALFGENPYMNNVDLWMIKTGRAIQQDISDKPYVKYGIDAERPMRELFALDHPQYRVSYQDFDIVRHPQYSFIGATLDGRIIERETGRIGAYEGKTTEILKSQQKESWKHGIPQNYYIQTLQEMLAGGFDFAILKGQLKSILTEEDGSKSVYLQTKHFTIEREKKQADLDRLIEVECKFWEYNVKKDIKPNLLLPNF